MQPKFCRKCGNAIKDGGKFCSLCGEPFIRNKESVFRDNPEGTVILGGIGQPKQNVKATKKGSLVLSFEEMLRGCTKIVDFGTGKKYEIVIPQGLSPGNVIKIVDTGIIDSDTGNECDIELTTSIE